MCDTIPDVMAGPAPLQAEFDYYLKHQDELASLYQGRFIVIKDGVVLGHYETAGEAARATVPAHKPGTFLIQRCDADPESTKATCHSRVIFV